jgi:hypothetical protein
MITMANEINSKQNKSVNINRLKAQRTLYSSAKITSGFLLLLSVPLMIIVTVVALIFGKGWFGSPETDLTWLVVSVSLFVVLIDIIFLDNILQKKKEKAAKIQQLFDCDVLNLRWSSGLYGEKVGKEDVEKWANKFNGDETKLQDWYAQNISRVPQEIGVVICQISNCWWDKNIRVAYNSVIIVIGILMLILSIGTALILDLTFKDFFTIVISPLLPFLIFAIKAVLANKKSITSLIEIRSELNLIWDNIIEKKYDLNTLGMMTNEIQHSIFLNRKDSPLMFDWVYWLSRDSDEGIMNKTSDEYLNDFEVAMGLTESTLT